MNQSPTKWWVQVLYSRASAEIVFHWQAWLTSRGIEHAIRDSPYGPALFRSMTNEEHGEYLKIGQDIEPTLPPAPAVEPDVRVLAAS